MSVWIIDYQLQVNRPSLELNLGSLVSEATALPTEPQPQISQTEG